MTEEVNAFFRGRRLLRCEIPVSYFRQLKQTAIVKSHAMTSHGSEIMCSRCGSRHPKKAVKIGEGTNYFYYCPACINLGRVQSNQKLYGLPSGVEKPLAAVSNQWPGTLTASQAEAAAVIVRTIAKKGKLLVDAVTGAGKTEMLFSGLVYGLKKGWRICLASPRVDVCLELHPRLAAAFPMVKLSLLHAHQTEPYDYAPLVICTTHQLLRFYQAFDVLIIDEVDAFPYKNNPMLEYAVGQAQKSACALLLLSATPPPELYQAVAQGIVERLHIPSRHHGFPLPVPQAIWIWQLLQMIRRGKLPVTLELLLQQLLARKGQTLIFCPTIKVMHQLEMLLKRNFATAKISSVHAQEPYRHEKVRQMRQGAYDLLLTSTILERGVTFSGIDVVIVASNHAVFDEASLVQIAGRVGRRQEQPTGVVYFIHDGWSRAMRRSIKRIKQDNLLASQQKEGKP